MTEICFAITINQKTTLQKRNYLRKLPENVESKHQKEPWELKFVRLHCTGKMKWIILAIWIAHFMVLLFCNKLSKKLWLTYAYSWTFPFSRIRASALLSGPTLHHSERTYFMDNSQVMLIILLHVRSVWKQKHQALEQTKFPIIYLYVKRKRRVFH